MPCCKLGGGAAPTLCVRTGAVGDIEPQEGAGGACGGLRDHRGAAGYGRATGRVGESACACVFGGRVCAQ